MKKIFSCSKYEKIFLIFLVLILLTRIIQIHSSYIFKPNKVTIENITFYCENYEHYGNENVDDISFYTTCNTIAEVIKKKSIL